MQSNPLGKPIGDNINNNNSEGGYSVNNNPGANNGHKKRGRGDSPSSSMMSSRISSSSAGGPGQTGSSSSSHHHHSHHSHFKDHQQMSSMAAMSSSESKFYSLSSIDSRDPLEQTLEDAYTKLQALIVASTETSASFNELVQFANQSKMHQDDVTNALLYSSLTDPMMAPKCLRNLFLVCGAGSSGLDPTSPIVLGSSSSSSSAGLGLVINNLLNLITENYFKLLDLPRQQLLWLLRELVKARVNQFDKLLLQMLRNIQSGSLADKNIWLAESMLDILYDQTTSNSNSSGSSKINLIYFFFSIFL